VPCPTPRAMTYSVGREGVRQKPLCKLIHSEPKRSSRGCLGKLNPSLCGYLEQWGGGDSHFINATFLSRLNGEYRSCGTRNFLKVAKSRLWDLRRISSYHLPTYSSQAAPLPVVLIGRPVLFSILTITRQFSFIYTDQWNLSWNNSAKSTL